jgi:hypothetical protein
MEKKMSEPASSSRLVKALVAVAIIFSLAAVIWCYLENHDSSSRGEALAIALRPVIEKSNTDQALVAKVILGNYEETRLNAAHWSGVYWGFTFIAAGLSALAALVLKLETIMKNEGAKKDLAALFSVTAALLITISTGGDFQRKWQANRVAAAELERTGYDFLEKDGTEPRTYLASVGQTLLRRNMAIVGSSDQRKSP